MKVFNAVKALLVLVVLLVANSGFSQVAVERSKEKVVISGVPYYYTHG